MEKVIDDILSIFDYIIFRKENDVYKKYLNKEHNYNIEYISPISITIIPRTIYVFTDRITDNYDSCILKFYVELLYKIHQNINKRTVPTINRNNIGAVEKIQSQKKISIIRGATLYPLKGTGYEIWIYADDFSSNDSNLRFINVEYTSKAVPYRIIICKSCEVESKIDNLSITIYLEE